MSAHRLQIEMLGGLRICWDNGRPVELARQQTGALLAFLALRPGEVRAREQVVCALWPDEDPEECRRRLRQALYRLHRELDAIGEGASAALLSDRDTIALDRTLIETDVRQFTARLESADAAELPLDRARELRAAVDLYRGPLLPGYYQECFVEEQRRIAYRFRHARLALPAALEAADDLPGAIEAARAAVEMDPLAEEAHCALMRLLAHAGQPSAVLRQYQDLSRILHDELNEEPSAETRRLMESLRQSGRTALAANGAASMNGNQHSTPAAEILASWRPARRPRLRRRLAAGVALAVLLVAAALWRAAWRPSTPSSDIAFIPLDCPPARIEWTRVIPLQPGDKSSEPADVAIDSQDNVYVAGFVDTAATDVDYLTQKISPTGDLLWQKRYDGPAHDVDRARSVMVDLDGNVVVTGDSDNGRGNGSSRLCGLDIATVKYDRDGNQLCEVRWNGKADGEDRPCKIAIDLRNGDAIIAGWSWCRAADRGRGAPQIVCLRIDRHAAGPAKPIFATTFLPSGLLHARASDLSVGVDGASYVAGWGATGAKQGPDSTSVVAMLDSKGHIVWQSMMGGKTANEPHGPLLGGDVLASTDLRPSQQGVTADILLTRFSLAGSELWSIPLSAAPNADDSPLAIGRGYGGDTFLAGRYWQPGGADHLSLFAFDTFGARKWARRLRGTSVGPDWATRIQVRSDSLYIVGCTSMDRRGNADCRLLALKLRAHDGEPVWMSRSIPLSAVDGGIPSADTIRMVVCSDGSMVVTCQVRHAGRRCIEVVKFAP